MNNFKNYVFNKKIEIISELIYENNLDIENIFQKFESGEFTKEEIVSEAEGVLNRVGNFIGSTAAKIQNAGSNIMQGMQQGYQANKTNQPQNATNQPQNAAPNPQEVQKRKQEIQKIQTQLNDLQKNLPQINQQLQAIAASI